MMRGPRRWRRSCPRPRPPSVCIDIEGKERSSHSSEKAKAELSRSSRIGERVGARGRLGGRSVKIGR